MGGLVIYRQRGNWDCMLASLATALQRDYGALWSEAFQAKVEANGGTYGDLVTQAWAELNMLKDVDYFQTPVMVKFSHPAFIRAYLDNFGPARVLLQVPSLNDEGKAHLIFYHRGQLYDPSNRKRYETIADLTEIQWVTVFDEKRVP